MKRLEILACDPAAVSQETRDQMLIVAMHEMVFGGLDGIRGVALVRQLQAAGAKWVRETP
jgi:aryl carrier-like protein